MKVVITGANGHLGRRLLGLLAEQANVCAVVRSERAKATLVREFGSELDIRIVDYTDTDTLAAVLDEGDKVIHLVGIIKETADNRYVDAHERACQALANAAAASGAAAIVVVGILGSDAASRNPCLASRGRSEEILLQAKTPARIIRVPMVLGEGDYAANSLSRQAKSRLVVTFRKQSLEQPIYAGDIANAVAASLDAGFASGIVELAGPESLTRESLITRAAARVGGEPVIVSLPIWTGYALTTLFQLLPSPPLTRAMLGVLDHDDSIDVVGAVATLGIELTSLDETLRRVIR